MKHYIAALTLLLMTCAVHAQKLHPGLKGGLNVYNVVGNQPTNYVPKFSYHFGVLTHIHMGDKFAIQPEVIYSAQGARYENSSLDLRLKYVNVPILFQYMFAEGFRLQAGPQLGILASAKTEADRTKTDVKGNFQGADLGLTAGVSYVKPSTGLGFDLRYNQGFTRINESSLYRSYNSGIQLGIFYLISHGHKVDQD
jgi:hypothetical protein